MRRDIIFGVCIFNDFEHIKNLDFFNIIFEKKNFVSQIFKFEEKILIMKISVPVCLNEWNKVRSLLKTFLAHYNEVPMTTHKYF